MSKEQEVRKPSRQQVRDFFRQQIPGAGAEPQEFKLKPEDVAARGGSGDEDSLRKLNRKSLGPEDPYITIKRLGSGGNGACFAVKVKYTNVVRACKVIPSRPDRLEIQTKEADILLSLPRHKNIPIFYGSGFTKGQRQIFMEYCSGGDLHQMMATQIGVGEPFCEEFVWHCFEQLTAVIAFIHFGFDRQNHTMVRARHGGAWLPVIHGDIKPGNIFLRPTRDGNFPDLVLGDFGNAVYTPGRAFIGTPIWSPPEMPWYSNKTDVWGVGAVIWALCKNGRSPKSPLPNSGDDASVRWERDPVARLTVPLGPNYSQALSHCVVDALTDDPTKRPQSIMLYGSVSAAMSRRERPSSCACGMNCSAHSQLQN